MANSAARIAEIRQALSSTGKSVSHYSASFAAGQAPEQEKVQGVIAAAAAAREASVGSVMSQDEVFNLLAELTSTCKVRACAQSRRTTSYARWRRTCAAGPSAEILTKRTSLFRGCGASSATLFELKT